MSETRVPPDLAQLDVRVARIEAQLQAMLPTLATKADLLLLEVRVMRIGIVAVVTLLAGILGPVIPLLLRLH